MDNIVMLLACLGIGMGLRRFKLWDRMARPLLPSGTNP